MKKIELVNRLIENNFKISMAESCTGGLLASEIVSVPSASKVFDMSFVTYSNEAKIKLCGVKRESIEKYNVVSEVVAKEMAEGACKNSDANVGVGITGVAGPTGGTAEIPVGTVCFGICINGITSTFLKHFSGNRTEVRRKSVNFVIEMLLKLI